MSVDGGRNWRFLYGGRVYPVAVIEIDPTDPKTVYLGWAPSQIVRTMDRGQTWDTLLVQALYQTSLAITPTNESILYAGYASGLFKSTDKGINWNQLPFISPLQAGPQLLVDPRDDKVIYATVLGYDTTQPGGVFKSTDGGATWTEKNTGLSKQNRETLAIRMNPRHPDDLFLGVNSNDSSGNWLFRTTDGGEHWFNFSNGFPKVVGGVSTIAIDTLNERIYAGVISWFDTQGIYILDSFTTGVNFVEQIVPAEVSLSQNYPNPFNPSTAIRYELAVSSSVTLKIYDVLGREVATLVNERKGAATYEVRWDGNKFPRGVYFYQLKVHNSIRSKKMVLSR